MRLDSLATPKCLEDKKKKKITVDDKIILSLVEKNLTQDKNTFKKVVISLSVSTI